MPAWKRAKRAGWTMCWGTGNALGRKGEFCLSKVNKNIQQEHATRIYNKNKQQEHTTRIYNNIQQHAAIQQFLNHWHSALFSCCTGEGTCSWTVPGTIWNRPRVKRRAAATSLRLPQATVPSPIIPWCPLLKSLPPHEGTNWWVPTWISTLVRMPRATFVLLLYYFFEK